MRGRFWVIVVAMSVATSAAAQLVSVTSDFQIDADVQGSLPSSGRVVAGLGNGEFVAVYDGPEVFAQRFDETGSRLGSAFQVNGATSITSTTISASSRSSSPAPVRGWEQSCR